MTTDNNQVVQTMEPVLPVVEQVSPEGAKPPVVVPPEPSSEAKMAEMIQKAVTAALAGATEASKREIQSTKDKAKAEVEFAVRRARLAENTLSATDTSLQGLDPETAKEIELARLRAEKQGRLTLEQEETARREHQQFIDTFYSGLHTYVTKRGIDPQDKRIDWGAETMTPLEIQQRVLNSVSEIESEKDKSWETKMEQKIKATETRLRKDLGVPDLDSVATGMSSGISSSGIPTDMKRFKEWVGDLSMSAYEKLKPDIDKMLAEDRIK